MPADVILEMRVKWGRNGIGERRKRSPTASWFRIDSFLLLFSPRGTPKSHLRIGESCRKRTLSTRGIGPAKRWYCYRGLLCVSTDETQISITIPPRSMVLYHNYFRKMSKMRAAGRPEPPRHSRTSLALKIDTFSKDFKQKPILF